MVSMLTTLLSHVPLGSKFVLCYLALKADSGGRCQVGSPHPPHSPSGQKVDPRAAPAGGVAVPFGSLSPRAWKNRGGRTGITGQHSKSGTLCAPVRATTAKS